MRNIEIKLSGGCVINITIGDNGSGSVESTLHQDGDNVEYKTAIDAIESLLLTLTLAGVDIQAKNFIDALETTLEAVWNNCGEE